MRRAWPRSRPAVDLDPAAVAELIRAAIPGARIVSVAPLGGGLSNTNIDVVFSGPPHRVVLRLYQGEPTMARKEVKLSGLLSGRVPVARFLHFDESNNVTGHPYTVLEWIAGERLDDVVPTLDDAALGALGESVGDALARIHAVRFDKHGFFDGDLNLPERIDLGPNALRSYLRQQLVDGRGGERLGPEITRETLALADRDGHLLDMWRADPCLVHADFNGSNILVRRQGAAWRVAAVLDWEFALSGIPALDFGNLMRPPLGERDAFAGGVAAGYVRSGGALPEDWGRIARIADLFAWADILGRPETGGAVIEDARAAVRAAIHGAAPHGAASP